MEDLEEFVGQIIDIFEDNITDRDINAEWGDSEERKTIEIEKCFLDEDSDGVVFGGAEYDKVAEKIKDLLKNWKVVIQ